MVVMQADRGDPISDVGIGLAVTFPQLQLLAALVEGEDRPGSQVDAHPPSVVSELLELGYVVPVDGCLEAQPEIEGLIESLIATEFVVTVDIESSEERERRFYHVGPAATVQQLTPSDGELSIFAPLMTRDLLFHFAWCLFPDLIPESTASLGELPRSIVRSALSGQQNQEDADLGFGDGPASGIEYGLISDLAGWVEMWSLRTQFGVVEFAVTKSGTVWLLPSDPNRETNPTVDRAMRLPPSVCLEVLSALFPRHVELRGVPAIA